MSGVGTGDEAVDAPVSFKKDEDGDGVVVSDTVERRRVLLGTPAPVNPEPASQDEFLFPVDAAVTVPAETLTLSKIVATYVRDGRELVAEIDHNQTEEFPPGSYLVELEASVKLYIQVEGRLTISVTGTFIEVSTDCGEIAVGARSYHRRPQTTITTTSDPEDLMRAVSTFGSALKTTSVERSYPTLRGHPPILELGESLRVPDAIDTPETGVTIELPPERQYVYSAASLAYYLGADVVPGERPVIRTDTGFSHPLDDRERFDVAAEQTLKQVFLFDCLTRTEGFYPVELSERRELAHLGFDFERLYDQSLSTRLERYLSVPFADVEDQIPQWHVTGHLAARPQNARLLPYLVDDLASIREPRSERITTAEMETSSIRQFTRTPLRADGDGADRPVLIRPEETGSLESVWADDHTPVNATKASLAAYRNRLKQTRKEGAIGVTVVCNDTEMLEETERAESVYGDDSELPFDVRTYHDVSRDALRAIIETERDFLHFIGHIDAGGMDCHDGRLDVRELDEVGVDAFLLNACSSYEQGMAMLERGAISGVVTLSDVINSGAIRVGKAVARLLNNGFPLNTALKLARDRSIVGGQYIVVGDGSVDLVQTQTRTPMMLRVETRGDEYRLTPVVFATNSAGMGCMAAVYNGEPGLRYLIPGALDTFDLTKEELEETFALANLPVRLDGELVWSADVSL